VSATALQVARSTARIDTRALTALIREKGMPNAVIAHEPSGRFDLDVLKAEARQWPGLVGMDLVPTVTTAQRFTWNETPWQWDNGAYGELGRPEFHVVAIDYGIKRNILRQLAGNGCTVTVVPARSDAADILALKPDGIFLSNGPGDPAATGEYAVPVIRELIGAVPTFGICLGHQMLALAVGAKTMKMHQGHHGANHPVKDLTTGKVEITSMNHGFAVDRATLPDNVVETHVSLFDGSNCGIALKDRPVFSVQYHPEASPGPRDSHGLFRRFVGLMREFRRG
jgi:carbamoyl-phosphate synthase small subunit